MTQKKKIKTRTIQKIIRRKRVRRYISLAVVLCIAGLIGGFYLHRHTAGVKQTPKQETSSSAAKTDSSKHKKVTSDLKPWYTYHSVAHAMGGLDGKDYLNSIDGFYPAYEKGYRIFEMDILLTSDHVAVGKHRWGVDLSDPTTKKGNAVSYQEFKNTKIYGKYTPTSFLDILNLMQKYPDFYLMTDSKSTQPDAAKKEFQILVNTAKRVGKEDLLDRIIVQVYNQKMYYAVKSVYPFKNFIYTTYQQRDAAFYRMIKFCKANGIQGVTCPENDINDYRMELLKEEGIYSYTHSVNHAYFAKEYMKLGVYGIYSDFLFPTQINKAWIQANCSDFAWKYLKSRIPVLRYTF